MDTHHEKPLSRVRWGIAALLLLAMGMGVGWWFAGRAGQTLLEVEESTKHTSPTAAKNVESVPGKRQSADQADGKPVNQGESPRGKERPTEHPERQSRSPGVVDLKIYITYDDGVSYEGPAGISYGTGSEKRERIIVLGPEQPLVVPDVNIASGVEISLVSRRAGFEFEECALSAKELATSGEIRCVIPQSQGAESTVVIDLSGFDPNCVFEIRLEDESGYTEFAGNGFKGGAKYSSGTIGMRLNPTRYRIVVIGPQVWQSELFDLPARTDFVLKAEPQEPVTVTAQPVDEAGTPLAASVLFRESGLYLDQQRLSASPGSALTGRMASPGNDGIAKLTGLAPGHQTICLQGSNTEIVRFELTLAPGTTHDLGIVRLVPAKGQIEVTITGAVKVDGYSVELLQPMRLPVIDPESFIGSRATLEHLPCRKYTVAVKVNATGRCYWKNVEITPAQPHLKLEFDVSKPPPEEE